MTPQDPDRTERLEQFVDWVSANIKGDEKGEAQIFLDRLFQAFGHAGCLDVGGTPEFRIRKARQDGGGTAFADYVWKPHVLIEMKKRGEDLARHHRQAFDYWTRLTPGRPHYVLLCNFDEVWVYDFDVQIDTPVDRVPLAELPQRYGPLAFLFPTHETPVFGNDNEKVTREAAERLAVLFKKLSVRQDVGPDKAQRFVLQLLVALFAEDIGLLDQYTIERLVADCKQPQDSYDLIGGLFEAMNEPDLRRGGRFKDIPYFNGGIFADPAHVELHPDELNQIKKAAEDDWSMVRPEIFGTIFEQTCNQDERHAYGAHFTSAVDIYKIIRPTIVEPWERLIDGAKTLKRLRELQERMHTYRVLDPACGSGNFLYLAYRELKRLEKKLNDRITELSKRQDADQMRLSFVTTKQFFGMDINPFAVELAKVTMMLAHKLAIDELHSDEPALPLDNLDENFQCIDALIDEQGNPTAWPDADVVIGNPPFLGAKRLKPERGADYVNAVRALYPGVPGMADYCVYWFRRTHDHLHPCTPDNPLAGRAGLVGTQNIRNNKSREGGLDHITASGTVVDAVDNQPWSGEANVHVSIANWVKHAPHLAPGEPPGADATATNPADLLIPDKKKLWFKTDPAPGAKKKRKRGDGPATKEYELDCRLTDQINSALSDETDVSRKKPLTCNKKPKRCYQGKIPGYSGFMLNDSDAKRIRTDSNEVVVPYITGRELLDEFVIDRWAIDFQNRDIIEAGAFTSAFDHCRTHVLPAVQKAYDNADKDNLKARKEHLDRWWQFWNRRDALNIFLGKVSRYIGCSRTTRRPVVAFISSTICPSDLVQVFAFEDDYSFGVLQANTHFEWFRKSSRLKVETDVRYSVRSVFETFPWPQSPSVKDIDAVAEAGREVRRVRAQALENITGGLRAVYRTMELPGRNPLKDAHAALDAAVLKAYGFNANKDLLKQLLDLNLDVADRIERGEDVTAPGVPPNHPRPDRLVTDDCIRP